MAKRQSSSQPPPALMPGTRAAILIAALLAGLFLAARLAPLLAPVAMAALLAYVLNPAVEFLMRSVKISRTGATVTVYLVLVLALFLIPAGLIPMLASQIGDLDLDVQAIFDDLRALVERYETVEVAGITIQVSSFYEDLQQEVTTVVGSLVRRSATLLSGAVSGLLWLIFVLIISFYMLKDFDRIGTYLDRLPPPPYREDLAAVRMEISQIWNAFLRGQLLLSLVVGTAVGVSTWLVGVPNALVLAVLAGILEILPTIGPVLAAIPGITLAFFQGSLHLPISNTWFALLVTSLYILIQQVENNYLVPRIMGRSVNLHPIVILVGAIAGASIAGLVGVFLVAPVLGSLRILARYLSPRVLGIPVDSPLAPAAAEAHEAAPAESDSQSTTEPTT